MPPELKTELETLKQRTPPDAVRLNPVPAKNTLLTIIFFSAVAAAILYWIFFPPAPPQTSQSSATQAMEPADRN